MATYTAAAALDEPRAIHAGTTTKPFSWDAAGTTTTAATAYSVLLAKIPNKATIVDLVETHSGPSGSSPADFGVQGDTAAFLNDATIGAVNRMAVVGGVNYDISLSDDAASQYTHLVATVTPGTTTATAVIKGAITYVMD